MSIHLENPPEAVDDPPTVAERRALIERVAASAQFRRAARLRDFLLYVGTQSLKDENHEIHEQEIGAKVFGRSPSYDRSQDNIVRVNATELRKRIDQYFASEGAHEDLMFSIPRGGYMPVFYRRNAKVQHEIEDPKVAPAEEISTVHDKERRGYLPHLLWGAVVVALAITCFVLFRQLRSAEHTGGNKPFVAAFWSDFGRAGQATDIVLPDASISMSEEILHQPVSLSEYLGHSYIQRIESKTLSQDRREDLNSIFSHNLVTLGDFHAAQQILALAPYIPSLHLTSARFYEAESIKRNNLVLIGGKKANPWVHLFDDRMNFSLEYDAASHTQAIIVNRHPQPGEQASYIPQGDRNSLSAYSVIAYLPNPSHTANVIILTGTGSDATSASAEFLASDAGLKKLQETLHSSKLPYFEALLKTSQLSGTSFNAELLAYRTYPNDQ